MGAAAGGAAAGRSAAGGGRATVAALSTGLHRRFHRRRASRPSVGAGQARGRSDRRSAHGGGGRCRGPARHART
eukprot:1210859-Pleurochrysis_carterae.AAC.1